ncbi:hypothetical protein BDV97DRAFT_48272 [Delphinella strobiligena]|nr:hypothetical protein BDV97DRAFT_48272 [Delphinella strobiligena]
MADPGHAEQAPPSHPDANPFGYTILPPETNLSQRGAPILDDSLQTTLDHFFDNPDTNATAILQNPAMTNYLNNTDFAAFNFDVNGGGWPYQQSSFTTPDISQPFMNPYTQPLRQSYENGNLDRISHYESHDHTNIPTHPPSHDILTGFGLEEDAPEDVLKAATKLFEYRSQRQASTAMPQPPDLQSRPSFHHPLSEHQRRQSQPSQPSQPYHTPTTTSSQSYAASHYQQTNGNFRASIDASAVHSPTSPMSFVLPRHPYPLAHPYHFGSDSNFDQNGYNGPYQNINVEQPHIDFARGMAGRYTDSGVPSAASSHPQSPIATRQDQQQQQQQQQQQPIPHFYTNIPMKREGGAEEQERSNPNKRRRTIAAGPDDEDARFAPYTEPSPTLNNPSSPDGNDASPLANSQSSPEPADDDVPSNSRKRRKSSSAAQARANIAARRNLTEEQKRENHIKSEQKRRNIIKDGYKNLNDLVPNLKQGGFSKSATLTETVRELETLQAANETLRLRITKGLGMSPDELQALMDSM